MLHKFLHDAQGLFWVRKQIQIKTIPIKRKYILTP